MPAGRRPVRLLGQVGLELEGHREPPLHAARHAVPFRMAWGPSNREPSTLRDSKFWLAVISEALRKRDAPRLVRAARAELTAGWRRRSSWRRTTRGRPWR